MLTPVPAAMIRDLRNLIRPEPIDQPEWFDDSANIAALLEWLRDSDEGISLDRAIELVARPWRWTAEYEQMRREQMSADVAVGILAITQR